MLCPPQPPDPVVLNWIERHRHPISFALHMLGIPPTILGAVYIPIWGTLMSVPIFLVALGLFCGGFLLQFLGHACDGTEPGEIAYLRRWLWRRLGWSDGAPAAVRPESSKGLA